MTKKKIIPLVTAHMSLKEALENIKRVPQKRHIWNALQLLDNLELGSETAVAELGCSGHETISILHRMGINNITIADIDKEFLKGMRDDFAEEITIYQADFNATLPMADKSYDLVTTFEVAEHLISAEGFLKELHRIIKKDGHLLITTPNHAFYKSRLRALKGRRLGMEGMHFRFYTKDQFEEMLQTAGFKVVKRNSLGHIPFGDMKPLRKILGVKNVRHHIPESMEHLCAINFIWLCEKIG